MPQYDIPAGRHNILVDTQGAAALHNCHWSDTHHTAKTALKIMDIR